MPRRRANGEGSCYQLSDGTGRWRAVSADRTIYRIAATQREAIRKRDEALDQQGKGQVSCDSTVEQYLRSWLAVKDGTVRTNTLNAYVSLAEAHVIPEIGTVPLGRLSTSHIQRVIDSVTAKNRSVGTVHHVYSLMTQAFDRAMRKRLISTNPCTDDSIDLPRKPRREVQPLYADALAAFLAAAATDRLEALWLLLAGIGVRRGEAIAIDLQDTRVMSRTMPEGVRNEVTVVIRRSLQRVKINGKTQLVFQPPKTKKGYRTLELPHFAGDAVARWLAHREEMKAEAGQRWQESGLLFCTRIGTALEPRNVSRRFDQLLTVAGLPHSKLHVLRHTAISMLLTAGVDVKTVQAVAGHSTAAMTLDVYGHLLTGTAVAASKMDEAVARMRQQAQKQAIDGGAD